MLSLRDQFKAAYLHHCAERGLTMEETLQEAQLALEKLAAGEAAGPGALTKLVGWVPGAYTAAKDLALGAAPYAIGLGLAAPVALGAAGGYGAAKLTSLNDEDPTEVKQRELISALQRYTQQAKINKALKDYSGQARRPGRPLM